MKLSVLVPVYDRAAALADCLGALARQTAPRDVFEVIVCDDGSHDAPDTVAARFAHVLDVRVLALPHRNRAAALNAGIEAARGDVILFTDADMVPTPGLVAQHHAFHERDPRPNAALLGFMDWDPTIEVTRYMRYLCDDTAWQFGYGKIEHGATATWGYFYGGNTSVKRAFLLAHGVHDPTLTRAEDIELGYRLSLAGMELVYDATAVNHHRHFVTVRDFLKRNRAVGAALVPFARRHPQLTNYLPLFLASVMARDAERRGFSLDDLAARSEGFERVERLPPMDEQDRCAVWDFALWAWLGAGVR